MHSEPEVYLAHLSSPSLQVLVSRVLEEDRLLFPSVERNWKNSREGVRGKCLLQFEEDDSFSRITVQYPAVELILQVFSFITRVTCGRTWDEQKVRQYPFGSSGPFGIDCFASLLPEAFIIIIAYRMQMPVKIGLSMMGYAAAWS